MDIMKETMEHFNIKDEPKQEKDRFAGFKTYYANGKRVVDLTSIDEYYEPLHFNCNDIEGWGRLLVNKPINERLNHKFERLMYYQKDDTLVELLKYFDVVTREMLENGDYNQYFIDDTMRRKYPTYKLKTS